MSYFDQITCAHKYFIQKYVLCSLFLIHKIDWKIPVLESLFNKVVGPQPATLLKRIAAQVFFREFCEIYQFKTPPGDCVCLMHKDDMIITNMA